MDRAWLHGWPLLSEQRSVLIGTAVRCSGCGKFFGITCVAIPDDWDPPTQTPDWPFAEEGCPVHRPEPEPTPIPPGDRCRICDGTGRRPHRTLP